MTVNFGFRLGLTIALSSLKLIQVYTGYITSPNFIFKKERKTRIIPTS